MKSQVESGELMQRIRREARRHEHAAFPPAAPDEPSAADDALPMPPAPVIADMPSGGFSCETLLAQAGNMVDRARGKTTVDKSVPALLRRFFRNQGGYNDIVLETLARLREANRLLMTENVQLRLHAGRQTEWMQAAARRFARLEKRCADLEREDGLATEAEDA